jgi:hypothetical protein
MGWIVAPITGGELPHYSLHQRHSLECGGLELWEADQLHQQPQHQHLCGGVRAGVQQLRNVRGVKVGGEAGKAAISSVGMVTCLGWWGAHSSSVSSHIKTKQL